MTITELRNAIDSALAQGISPEARVVIPIGGNINPCNKAKINTAGEGFDWDKNRFFLWTSSQLVEKKEVPLTAETFS